MQATGTEARLCEMIAQRQARGLAKYGVTLENNPLPLRDWLQHLLEEQLDAAAYTLRAIEELDKAKQPEYDWKELY
jgi:hypothetical protein